MRDNFIRFANDGIDPDDPLFGLFGAESDDDSPCDVPEYVPESYEAPDWDYSGYDDCDLFDPEEETDEPGDDADNPFFEADISDAVVEEDESAAEDPEDADFDPFFGMDPDEYDEMIRENEKSMEEQTQTAPSFRDPDPDAEAMLINYNERFKDHPPILFRDDVVKQVLACLIGKYKPNCLLIGAAGVGKSRIVEDIARRIACRDPLIPPQLENCRVMELPVSNIISGSSLVGDVERKAKSVIDYASDPDNHVILFIDEAHMLMSDDRSYDKVAQMLKPALARGAIRMIGATTLQESNNFMHDPAFSRRFIRITVDEFSKEQTKAVLAQLKDTFSEHYGRKIVLGDKMLDYLVNAADELRTAGSHRPDSAVTLLDRAIADTFIERSAVRGSSSAPIRISRELIKQTACKLISGSQTRSETDMDSLKQHLEAIKGQDDVLDAVVDSISRDSLGLFPRTKPLSFLFAGPSGVGKSETANIIARELTGTVPITINMTEYTSDAAITRIIGAPAGYTGYDSKAELPFDILDSNPYQVILLDEFEKCHPAVRRLFMRALDAGTITTAQGKVVDFSKAIIVATTNAGQEAVRSSIGFDRTDDITASVRDLTSDFEPELLNRFTRILNFHPISENMFMEIIKDKYSRQMKNIRKFTNTVTELPDELPCAVAESLARDNYTREFGARPAENVTRAYIENEVISERRHRK